VRRGASLDFAQHTSCRHPLYPLRHALAEERETRCKPDPLRIRRRRLRSHTSLEVKTSTMAADDSTWGASGEVHVARLQCTCKCRANGDNRSDEPGIPIFRRRRRMERRSLADRPNRLRSTG
jgi:hypothetical protein